MIWVVSIVVIFVVLLAIGLSSYTSVKQTFTVVAIGLLILFSIGAIFGGSLRGPLNWGDYKSYTFNAEDVTKFYKYLFNMSPSWFQTSIWLSPFVFFLGRITGWYRTHQKTLPMAAMFEMKNFFKFKFLILMDTALRSYL